MRSGLDHMADRDAVMVVMMDYYQPYRRPVAEYRSTGRSEGSTGERQSRHGKNDFLHDE